MPPITSPTAATATIASTGLLRTQLSAESLIVTVRPSQTGPPAGPDPSLSQLRPLRLQAARSGQTLVLLRREVGRGARLVDVWSAVHDRPDRVRTLGEDHHARRAAGPVRVRHPQTHRPRDERRGE